MNDHEHRYGFCDFCHKERCFYKPTINHKMHFIFAVLSGGLWLISWISLMCHQKILPWACSVCSEKKVFEQSR